LLGGDIAREFLESVLAEARSKHWLSDERFSVDGTQIQAWANRDSYQPKDNPPGPGEGSGRDGSLQKRDLYESKTDPEARLFKKNGLHSAMLCYLGHVLSDSRNGLVAAARVTLAGTRAEREAAVDMVRNLPVRKRRIQVAADKAYDENEFVESLRQCRATPQVTQYTGQRSSAIDRRTTRQVTYQEAQKKRKRIERIFAWLKHIASQRRTRFRGREKVEWMFTFSAAAYNLLRMSNLSRIQSAAA
jgi:hypothetical protein